MRLAGAHAGVLGLFRYIYAVHGSAVLVPRTTKLGEHLFQLNVDDATATVRAGPDPDNDQERITAKFHKFLIRAEGRTPPSVGSGARIGFNPNITVI
jgi:hypothetical protein